MKILVANNHLVKTGGTENYTYTLALELQRQGHDVEYFTLEKGDVSSLLEKQGVAFMSSNQYDLILANHNTIVEKLWTYGYIIQTCHGCIPQLEQPSPYADAFVAISDEVRDHLMQLGYQSYVIPNGIDCERFCPRKPVEQSLTTVLSLCQSDKANDFIKRCCEQIGVKFLQSNKYTDNIWSIEDVINQSDLVIGLGRSVYDAMACGRAVIIYDYREYMGEFLGDGMITSDNIELSLRCNCSGRSTRLHFTEQSFIKEMQKFNPEQAEWNRKFAIDRLNIEKVVKKYLDLSKDRQLGAENYAFKHRLKNIIDDITCERNLLTDKNKLLQKQLDSSNRQILALQNNMSDFQHQYTYINRKYLRAKRGLIIFCIVLIVILILMLCYWVLKSC